MKKNLSNDRGVTLVELLAGLVIATILMIIVVNITLTIQSQFTDQSDDAEGLFNVTLAVKDITREIRRNPAAVSIPDNHTIIFNVSTENEIIFKFQDNTLLKNNKNFINGIESFHVEIVELDNKEVVTLKIESNEESKKSIDTQIVIR